MKKLYYLLLLFVGIGAANAQQITLDNQYLINKFALSPAFAGFNGNIEVFAGYRKNWMGVEGSPTKQLVNANTPFYNGGLGLNISTEQTGNLQYFSGMLSYAHHVELSNDMSLSFGLGAEMYRNQLDISNISGNKNDPLLLSQSSLNGTTFDATFGTMFYTRKFTFGIVVPRMLGMKVKYDKDNSSNQYALSRQILIHSSFLQDINSDWTVEPTIVLRKSANSPFFYEIATLMNYKKAFWTGLTYRKGSQVGIHVGGALDAKFVMNYSYEFGFSDKILSLSAGTHELSLGYLINYGKKKSPITVFREPKATAAEDNRVAQLLKDVTQLKNAKNKKDTAILKEIAALKSEIDELKKNSEQGMAWGPANILKSVEFGNNSDKLFSSSFPELDKWVNTFKKKTDTPILIVGHTDNVGSPRYNELLSKRRAEEVKKYFVSKGIDEKRIKTDGKGDTKPIASNETREGRATNRRIEVYMKK